MTLSQNNTVPSAINGLDAEKGFIERRKYVRDAYPFINPDHAFDLWYGNKMYYGKVDLAERAVLPEEQYLKLFQDAPELVAINFVVDAYDAFYVHIIEAFSKKMISAKGTFLLDLKPRKAYISAFDGYKSLVDNTMNGFISNYIVGSSNQEKTKNYADFVKEFIKFSDVPLSLAPFTLTRYIKSKFCSNLCSGLIVEVSDARYDDDAEKYVKFLNDKNFNFYQNAAKKFGFRIDYNAPWRLIADIKSLEMKQFMVPYGITSAMQMFDRYYVQSVDIEAEFFSNLFENYYIQYIEKFPHYRKPKTVFSDIIGELKNCKYTNKPIHPKERWQVYDALYHYMLFRSKEEAIPFNYRFIRSRVVIAEKVEKRFDRARAMRYINDEVFKNSRV